VRFVEGTKLLEEKFPTTLLPILKQQSAIFDNGGFFLTQLAFLPTIEMLGDEA
jgi:hypothetical protein